MKKIENIIDNCKDCRFHQRFNPQKHGCGSAFICEPKKQLLTIGQSLEKINIPEWCPLETYVEASIEIDTASAKLTNGPTVILSGLPHLEWMTENLSGFGGTEINGRWYYTYDQAEEAVKQLGDGWRLPEPEEWKALDDLDSEWQEDGPHGLPGCLFGGKLFLEAAGYRASGSGDLANVGAGGYYWSSSSVAAGSAYAGGLGFNSGGVYPLLGYYRAIGFSVRCVRNVK